MYKTSETRIKRPESDFGNKKRIWRLDQWAQVFLLIAKVTLMCKISPLPEYTKLRYHYFLLKYAILAISNEAISRK